MSNTIYKYLRIPIIVAILLVQASTALASEILIFSNETQDINANTTIFDDDNTGGDIILQFGNTLNERLYWDNSGTTFIFTDDLNVTGNLDVDGTVTTGTSGITITNSAGYLDGEQIATDTIDDDSIDFGMGTDQVGADDITMTDEFASSSATNVQDVMDDIDQAVADIQSGSASILGTQSGTYTLDNDDTGGNVDLVFGTTVGQYLRHDGTLFHFSDDLIMDTDKKIEFRDSAIFINSSLDGQLDIDADTEVEITTPTVDLNGNIDISGTITSATIDGDNNTIQDVDWTSLKTRTKKIKVDISDFTIIEDGSNNLVNLYADSETGTNPHEYLLLKSTQATLQDVDIKIKVRLPADFVDFTTASNDIGFYYKNTGTNNTDSKIDILVEDDDGDDAYTATDGQGLFNVAWTSYSDEFDGGSFNPGANEYIFITIKGYASYDSGYQSPYIGEITLTYTGK